VGSPIFHRFGQPLRRYRPRHGAASSAAARFLTVDASVVASVALTLGVGKLVELASTAAATLVKDMHTNVAIAATATASALKAVAHIVPTIAVSVLASTQKNVGNALSTAVGTAVTFPAKAVGKLVLPTVATAVTFPARAISFTRSFTVSATPSVTKAVAFLRDSFAVTLAAEVTKNAGKNVDAFVSALVSFFNAFITSTHVIQKPVDYVIEWTRKIAPSWSEHDVFPSNLREKAGASKAAVQKLSGDKPSFTTKTGKKGYD